MPTWHYTWATRGRVAAFRGEVERRAAVRALVRVGNERLMLFALVDDHVHAVVRADRDDEKRLARGLRLAALRHVDGHLEPAYIREVATRSYLEWLVRYVLTQTRKHGLEAHPALWSGSVFQDLVGARVVGGWQSPLAEALPRWKLTEAFGWLDLGVAPLEPLGDERMKSVSVGAVLAAAASAACVAPGLAGRSEAEVEAKRAVIALLDPSGRATDVIAEALGMTTAGVRRLRGRPANVRVERATRVRLALEDRVAERQATRAATCWAGAEEADAPPA